MLGIDWLEHHECLWNFKAKCMTIDGQDTVTLRRRGHLKCQRVLAQGYQEVPPRSQKDVVARVTLLSKDELPESTMIGAKQLKPGRYVGRTLLPTTHHNVKIRVVNTTEKPQPIPLNTCLGQAMPVTVVTSNKRDSGLEEEGHFVCPRRCPSWCSQYYRICRRTLPLTKKTERLISSTNSTICSPEGPSIWAGQPWWSTPSTPAPKDRYGSLFAATLVRT